MVEHQARRSSRNANELLDGAEPFDWLGASGGISRSPLVVCESCAFALARPAVELIAVTGPDLDEAGRSAASAWRQAGESLLPFPDDLRYGRGLDFHCAQVIESQGLGMGVVDVVAVKHVARKVASTYSWDAAQDEGRAFLARVSHVPASAGMRSLRTYRRVPHSDALTTHASA